MLHKHLLNINHIHESLIVAKSKRLNFYFQEAQNLLKKLERITAPTQTEFYNNKDHSLFFLRTHTHRPLRDSTLSNTFHQAHYMINDNYCKALCQCFICINSFNPTQNPIRKFRLSYFITISMVRRAIMLCTTKKGKKKKVSPIKS